MRGHIFRRFKGSYQIVLYLGKDPVTGKYKQKWIAVKGKRRNAEHVMSELMHQYNTTGYLDTTRLNTKEFLERWIDTYQAKLRVQTAEAYRLVIVHHLIPELGNIQLSQLRPDHLQRYYAKKVESGLSPRTVKYHHSIIHKALQTAVKWGLLFRNVADGADLPNSEHREMKFWDADEMTVFLGRNIDNPYYALFYTALFTGMRRSELLGLKWPDIDFPMCQLSVRRSLHYTQTGEFYFSDVKSHSSQRTIDLTPTNIGILRKHFENTARYESDLIFNNDGKPLRPNTVTRAWQTACKVARVKVIRFHDARHTHATLLLKQGVHPKIVQERLGHSSITLTLDVYSHVTQGLQKVVAQRFDDLLKQKVNS